MARFRHLPALPLAALCLALTAWGQSPPSPTPASKSGEAPASLKPQPPGAPEEEKKRLPLEVRLLVDDARSAPAEFAADALLRLAQSGKIPEPEQQRELIEEAFRLAAHAQFPLPRKYLGYFHVDTRTGYLRMAHDLKLDRLSLQCRAVRAMLAVDRRKARELFGEMPRLDIPALTCADTLIPDAADFYETLLAVAQGTFSPDEVRRQETVFFLATHLGGITSPLQVGPAAKVAADFKASPPQREILVSAFAGALKKISGDDRAFTHAAHVATGGRAVSQLREKCLAEGVATEWLLEAFRGYLVTHFGGSRCADNVRRERKSSGLPDPVQAFNDRLAALRAGAKKIPPIAAEEIAPTRVEGEGVFDEYWKSPQARGLLIKIKALRFGHDQKSGGQPLTPEERGTVEWREQAAQFLNALAAWESGHEKSEADFFHQKAVLFSGLIELIPPGDLRDRVLHSFLDFLRQNRMQRESRVEWFFHARQLMQVRGKDDRPKVIEAMGNSGDPVLQLYAALERALPETK
jgi:hypothetical protein